MLPIHPIIHLDNRLSASMSLPPEDFPGPLILNSSHLFFVLIAPAYSPQALVSNAHISARYLSLQEQKPFLVSTPIYRTSIRASRSWLAFTKWVDIWVNEQTVGQIGRWMGSLPEQLLERIDMAGTFKVLGM